MRLATLLGPDLKAILETDPESLAEALLEFHPEDIAEICDELPFDDSIALLRILSDEQAADVLERLPGELQKEVFEKLSLQEAAELLSDMSPDDRVDAVQEMDEHRAISVIAHLKEFEPEVAEEVRELSAYADDVAGGLMTTDYISLAPETPVVEAIEEVRKLSFEDEIETVYYIYVLYAQKLVGVVSLRELILSDPNSPLSEIMTENIVFVRVQDDQEEVARTVAKYDFSAIPVLDEHGDMHGVVTIDDVVDVVIEEATEDAQRMGAVTPMDEGYFETSLWAMFRSRVTWLILLFLGGLMTATVMERYQADLRAVVALAVFIPLIISSGGNAGSQSASLVIRALAVGEVHPSHWLRVLGREAITSISLGVVLAGLGLARVAFFDGSPDPFPMAITVSVSILGVVVVGSLVGSLLPLGIQRIGLDPAVSSTPFIASVVDVIGLLIYLTVAGLVLGLH